MDLDKIVSDLVEKRFNELIIEIVDGKLKGYGDHEIHSKLHKLIGNIMIEYVKIKENEIRIILYKILDDILLNGNPLPKIDFCINFNMESYKLRQLLEETEKKENIK